MENKPLISVIVPIYNVEEFLSACLDSILAQTYTNLEIILVDDGSPDNCGKICDEYAQRDLRIIVIHKVNGGLSDARNVGLDICKGEFISFVDSDDMIHSQFIEKMYGSIEDADMVFCDYQLFYGYQDMVEVATVQEKTTYSKDEFFNKLVFNGTPKLVVAWNKLYKREIFSSLRYPEGKVHEDEFLIHHVVNKTSTINCINESLYYYRQNSNGITSVFSDEKFKNVLEAFTDRVDFLLANNKPILAKQVYNQMYFLFLKKNIVVDSVFWKELNLSRIISDQKFRGWLKFQLLLKFYFEKGYNNFFYPLNEFRVKIVQNL